MSRTIKISLTMEVKCETECASMKAFRKKCPDIPPELWHLDCLLDEHLDGYAGRNDFGRLTDISIPPDES